MEDLRDFIISFYTSAKENNRDALHEISKVVYRYMRGRVQVMFALAVMYYTTF
jgi:predicted PurR-regulated permease PerM